MVSYLFRLAQRSNSSPSPSPHRLQTPAASLSSRSVILISILVSELWSGSECCQAARARARYQVPALSVHLLAAAATDRPEEQEPGTQTVSPVWLQFNVITATCLLQSTLSFALTFQLPTIPDNRLIKPNYGRH